MAHVPYTHPARLTLSVARISWLTAASNPLVGSSRKRMEGRATSSRPMLTRLRCPPLIPASEGAGGGGGKGGGGASHVLEGVEADIDALALSTADACMWGRGGGATNSRPINVDTCCLPLLPQTPACDGETNCTRRGPSSWDDASKSCESCSNSQVYTYPSCAGRPHNDGLHVAEAKQLQHPSHHCNSCIIATPHQRTHSPRASGDPTMTNCTWLRPSSCSTPRTTSPRWEGGHVRGRRSAAANSRFSRTWIEVHSEVGSLANSGPNRRWSTQSLPWVT